MKFKDYYSLLKECIKRRALGEGQGVHAHIIGTCYNPPEYLRTRLIVLYIKCEVLGDAVRVFDEMPERNVVSWTAVISGFARSGCHSEALNLFVQMLRSGPYHFGKPQLKEFEQLKFPIGGKFCLTRGVFIEQLYDEVAKVGDSARKCYAEGSTERYNDEEFNRIMVLDALFVLFVMLPSSEADEDREVEKTVNQRLNKSFHIVLRDLFLLENQIPLLVLKVLMEFMSIDQKTDTHSFMEYVLQLFTTKPPRRNLGTNIASKFLKKMTGCSSKSAQKMEPPDMDESQDHLLQLVRKKLIRPIFTHTLKNIYAFINESNVLESYRSVTDLKSAGIYFKPNQTGNLADVEFKPRLVSGILTLPSIKVDHLTRPLLLNLVAYEMCPHGPLDLLITSYICLMDSLIDTADDVKELRQKRIISNKLGSDEQLAQLFNGIANDLVPDPLAYFDVKSKIDTHCKQKRHIWMAEWIHKYFSSPWTLLAFLGAILALALTMAQTVLAAYPR
ncbi:unnamed protein product [Fraxinus pennsylvanica]|uniref:Uncharacterized protein n=1 Tax=Fraxinus pennsylvanica TaxID=56036 RepID=A0AAD2A105_9LAMI|nr:unnamed protein product [Fraxinus pennsylvanica]